MIKLKLKNHRKMCSNSMFDIYFDHIEINRGQSAKNYLVIEPKPLRPDKVAGVAILPVTPRGIGFIQVYRHALRSELWEIPRGFVEKGESTKSAALRELQEELGLKSQMKNLYALGQIAPEPGIVAARIALFVAITSIAPTAPKGDEFGHRQIRYFSHKEIFSLMNKYVLQDPCSLVALYRYSAAFKIDFKQKLMVPK